MIAQLTVLDLLVPDQGPAPSDIVTPADRTIALGRSWESRAMAEQAMDPSDTVEFAIELGALLEEGESFANVECAIDPASADSGFSLHLAGPYAPRRTGEHGIRIWPTIESAQRGHQRWRRWGMPCSVLVSGTTDATPPRHFKRTAAIRVRQR